MKAFLPSGSGRHSVPKLVSFRIKTTIARLPIAPETNAAAVSFIILKNYELGVRHFERVLFRPKNLAFSKV
ncbi:MAG: hypothetical protein EPGJADBJ_00941 [Saprospiraceae bacterium]|nr:hypothetical protein [Saprospiraceae bacterium]